RVISAKDTNCPGHPFRYKQISLSSASMQAATCHSSDRKSILKVISSQTLGLNPHHFGKRTIAPSCRIGCLHPQLMPTEALGLEGNFTGTATHFSIQGSTFSLRLSSSDVLRERVIGQW